ncbi:hypothetical protein AXE65_04135 [Ventosimonas gracilis]|uniref:EamA domain-containing protein n=1 Tax=Ventosimonas gracilis TaxID=1680762 RepID=A0A139SRA5_9GAMM|nr:DMT family transporter [Ventosimonas gracilis]KXU37067.1 hypothetical protein AXE65_04135 [Ventosimonas gracilis]
MKSSNTLANNSHPLAGIGLMLLATFMFASHDALNKYLAEFYPIVMVIWVRYLIHTSLMAAWFLPRSGLRILYSKRPGLQVLRAFCLLATSLLFICGLLFIPLAESTAVNFLTPLLVTAFSPWVLNERVSLGQWLAVSFGFMGVLIIVHPRSDFFTPAILLPLSAALSFCGYQLLTRKLAEYDSSVTSNFFAGVQNTLIMTALVPFFWQLPASINHALWMLALGAFGMFSHLALNQAFCYAAPALLAPFSYCTLVFATAIGWIFFGQWPVSSSLLGIAVICTSGIAAAWLQQRSVST